MNGWVQAQVEELPENRVRLTVQVPSHDVHHAVEHAADDLASSVKVPGFRKGKVPRQVLLQRVGKERLMTEACALREPVARERHADARVAVDAVLDVERRVRVAGEHEEPQPAETKPRRNLGQRGSA